MSKVYQLNKLNKFTDWTAYTPVYENISADIVKFFWRRVWDSIDIRGHFFSNLSVSGAIYFFLPEGLSIDSTKTDVSSSRDIYGAASAFDTGVGYYAGDIKIYSLEQKLFISDGSGKGVWAAAVPMAWATGDRLSVNVTGLPIEGY